ncbi:MAG: hypothetical protein EAX86_10200 [Candidatus Heimdallarchaeota archaeon]|nr:hypothetical protein [Candidatus Heimdallarchaeota archaeon]
MFREFFKPLSLGVQRLLYVKNSQNELNLSPFKIFLLICFVLSIFFGFIQFTLVEISDIIILNPLTELEVEHYMIQPNIWGQLSRLLNFTLLLGIFIYTIGEDKPFREQIINLKAIRGTRKVYIIIGASLFFIIFILDLLSFIGRVTPFDIVLHDIRILDELSYRMGIVILYLWLLIQPALTISGSFLILNIIAYDYPNSFKGFKRRDIAFLLCELVFTITIIGVTFFLFGITTEHRPNPLDTQPFDIILEKVGFFRINFYWMLVNINLLLIVIVVLYFMFISIDFSQITMIKKLKLRALLGFIIFVLIMPITVTIFSLPANIVFSRVVISIDIIIFGFLVFYIFLVIGILQNKISLDYLDSRKGLLPWLLFFGLLFIFLKTIPSALILYSPRLKTLRSILDLFGMFIIISISIFRVISIPDSRSMNSTEKSNPKERRIMIPTYSRVLFLLYVSSISFYLSLESYSIAVLLHIPDYLLNLKLEFLTASTFAGAFYALWNYRPIVQGKQPGILKLLEMQIRKKKK